MKRAILILLVGTALLGGCVSSRPPKPVVGGEMKGLASWYGQEFAGRTTANGEIFDPMLLTAAHRTLPFGTVVQVKNPKSGQTVKVRINDRGPFIGDRIIDLSYAAAAQLGLIDAGVGAVELTVLKVGAGEREPPAPYVVTAGAAAPKPAPRPVDASAPPPVPFPLPPTAATPAAAEEPFGVDVREQRGGSEVRKQVAPDGRTIETVPTGEAPPRPAPQQPAEPAPARAQAPVPAVPGTFVVQLGSFKDEKNAAELRDRVAPVVDKVFVAPNDSMYRVRVGPYPTRAAAIDVREKLENAGFSGIVMPSEK